MEQVAYFIGKKNMYPAPKIFATARTVKGYEKFLKEIGLTDIVIAVVKGK